MVRTGNYWDEEIETMPLDKMRKLQGERLQEIVAYAYERTKFYRRKFDEAGVKPSDISSVDDLAKLPLIEDAEIRKLQWRISYQFPGMRYISAAQVRGLPASQNLWHSL